MVSVYHQKLLQANQEYQRLTKKYNRISVFRLLFFVALAVIIYVLFKSFSWFLALGGAFSLVSFLFLLKKHREISLLRKVASSKMDINQKEIDFLEKGVFFSDDGSQFEKNNHHFSYDLDVFGEKSLYHYINRTHTFLGRKLLAEAFLYPKVETIVDTQKAIDELANHLDWRQDFMAHTSQIGDSEDFTEKINQWINRKEKPFSSLLYIFLWASPLVVGIAFVLGYVFDYEVFMLIFKSLLSVNFVVFILFLQKILKNKLGFESILHVLYSFKNSLEQIENASQFQSDILVKTRNSLFDNNHKTSYKIKNLSKILDQLDNISNIMVSIPLNMFTFYHLHIYRDLLRWKQENAKNINRWLSIIAQREALCSFANFRYNNPNFVFPSLNSEFVIDFEDVGHPLIAENKRVTNSILFKKHHFIILTGSNMSGKSTFLRTLGVNMLFTLMGLPVCAKRANIHPLQILVSMRLSDSLSEGKSYFFAEINRIQQIMQTIENQVCFVLLDELLRGTNSQDKQQGTIKIIEKMVKLNAIGMIATHDLEVCKLSEKYPQIIENKAFEVQFVNNELFFDYKIRNGVCQSKNATFLLEKLNIV